MNVPENAREAEAVTADSLVPGLGALLGAAQGADLFVLSLPDLSGEIRSRRYLLMKAAAIVRSRSPSSRIAVLFHQPAGGGLFPPGAKELLSEEAAAFVDLLGLDLDDVATTPEAVREAADGLSFARPLLVTAPEVPGAGALLDLAARFSGVDAPVVAAPLADPAGVPLLDRLGALLDGDVNRDGRSATRPDARREGAVRLPVREGDRPRRRRPRDAAPTPRAPRRGDRSSSSSTPLPTRPPRSSSSPPAAPAASTSRRAARPASRSRPRTGRSPSS